MVDGAPGARGDHPTRLVGTIPGKISEKKSPNILTYLEQKKFDLVINSQTTIDGVSERDGYVIRRKAIDYNIPLINNVKIANLFAQSIYKYSKDGLSIKSLDEY